MKKAHAIGAALVGALLVFIAAGAVVSQGTPPATPPRSFDYWQPDWMVRELWGPGRMPKSMMVRLLRHTTYIQFGVPDEFAGAKSNVAPGPGTIAAGGRIFTQHCMQCHGKDGTGGGEGSLALSPSPALLAYMIQRPVAVDEYLLWSIADGGKQFGSAMPAFKDKLAREEIWRVIAYMRAGFSEQKGNLAK